MSKWRERATVEDLKTGPKAHHATTLTEAEEAIYEYIAKNRTSEPDRFIVDPIHQMPGLNT